MNKSSSIEVSEVPEWLVTLESRREKLTKARLLAHEIGAGASCKNCEKCPGLDLHFWRKVCRNCKCRKEQHNCPDDLTGWAQFEILGQIRSQSACNYFLFSFVLFNQKQRIKIYVFAL